MAKSILVEILGDASHFQKTLDKAAGSTRRFGAAAGVVGLAIAGGLVVGLEKSVAAAVDAQDSQRRLAQAFKNTGLDLASYKASLDAAQAAGRKLGFTDTEVRDSLGSLITATKDVGLSMKDLGVAQDLARFTGKDLVETTRFMTLAMTGSQRAIKALGLGVVPATANLDAFKNSHTNLTGEALKAATAHAKMLDKVATGERVIAAASAATRGQGQAYADTAAGGMAQFRAQMDHLEVSMGQGLLPALTAVAEKLAVVVNFFAEHTTVAKVFAVGLGVLAGALLAVSVASTIAAAATAPFTLPILAAVAAIAILSFVVYKLVKDFRANWPLLLPIVLGPLGLIIAAVVHWHSQITAAFTAAWNAVKGITMAGVNAVVGFIRGALSSAAAAAEAVGHAIVSGLKAGLAAIVGAITGAFAKVWAAIRGFASVALSVGKAIGEAVVSGVVSGLTSLASKAAGIIQGAISHLPHISIPGFSPIEHVGFAIGQMISSGITRGLREGVPPILKQLQGTISEAGNATLVFANSDLFPKLTYIGQRLAFELGKGFRAGGAGAPFTNHLAAAKKHTDQWVDTVATANMSGLGKKMAASVVDGWTGHQGQQIGGSALDYAPGGGGSSSGGVLEITMPVYLDGKQIAETVHRELLRKQSSNVSLGLT